jgi:hypothetical protein
MATLLEMTQDLLDSCYSFSQVKDKIVYLTANATDVATTITVDATLSRQIHAGMILEISNEDSIASELVRVKSVDNTTGIVTVTRGVRQTAGQAWTTGAIVRIEPEFPISNIIREINRELVGLPPHIWAMPTFETSVSSGWQIGYSLPAGAVGVQAVRYEPSGTQNYWQDVRRWKWDPVNKIVTVLQNMEPGRDLKITYRGYPTELALAADDLTDAGLTEELDELVMLGALYRLVSKRTSARLVDTRAETPMNQQYRSADPVSAAVRQLYAQYNEVRRREVERQRLLYPLAYHYSF